MKICRRGSFDHRLVEPEGPIKRALARFGLREGFDAHLARCAFCRRHKSRLDRAEQVLESSDDDLIARLHLTDRELFRYLARFDVGAMSPPERAAADRHLADCSDCREDLDRARRFDPVEVRRSFEARDTEPQRPSGRPRPTMRVAMTGLLLVVVATIVSILVLLLEPNSAPSTEGRAFRLLAFEGPRYPRTRNQTLDRPFSGEFRIRLEISGERPVDLWVFSIPDDGVGEPILWHPSPIRGLDNPLPQDLVLLPPEDRDPFVFDDFTKEPGLHRFFVVRVAAGFDVGRSMTSITRLVESTSGDLGEATTRVRDLLEGLGVEHEVEDVPVDTR